MPNLDIDHNQNANNFNNVGLAKKILHDAHIFALNNPSLVGGEEVGVSASHFDANSLTGNFLNIKEKSFTGAGNSTGSGLIGRVSEELNLTFEAGGVLKSAGIDFRANTNMETVIHNLSGNSIKFVKRTNGTAPTFNDTSTFSSQLLRLDPYQLEISGYADVISMSYFSQSSQDELVSAIMFLIDNAKENLADQIGIASVLNTSGTVAALNNSAPTTYAPLHTFMSKMISTMGSRTDGTNQAPIFILNSGTYHRLWTEQALDGQFINASLNSTRFAPVEVDPGSGFCGTFGTKKVYICNDILDTYQGNSSGTIVASGGAQTNKSAIMYGRPQSLFVRKGKAELDTTFKFDGQSGQNLDLRRTGQSVFSGETYMLSGLKSPSLWTYVLV